MQTKTCPARIKLDAGESTDPPPEADSASGTFEALVSVFGVKDSYGEIVMPGAFTKTLAAWEEKGDPIPIYWSHRLDDPDFNIGHVLDAKEIDTGLWIKGQLDLTNVKAKSVHNLMRARRVTDFSFSFNVPPGGAAESASGDAVELKEIDLYEVGPTPIGANPDTELIGVKAGRVLSAKNVETITAARDALRAADSALSDLLKLTDDGKSALPRRAKTEEPSPAKVEEPSPVNALDAALTRIQLASLM